MAADRADDQRDMLLPVVCAAERDDLRVGHAVEGKLRASDQFDLRRRAHSLDVFGRYLGSGWLVVEQPKRWKQTGRPRQF